MLKSVLLGLSAAALAASLAQAQSLPAQILEKKTISVANVPNYPPLEFKDPKTGALTGLDIDLGNALAKKLGVAIKWEEISFEGMIPALTTGRVDMILSGMSDLPSRRETLDFVDYLASGAQFYTNIDRKDEFKDLTALCGKKVGASRRTSFPKEMEGWSKTNCEAKGKPALEIVGTEGSADARTQLRQKRLDAAVQGSETLPYLMDQDKGLYAILGTPFTTVHQGMAFAKKDTQLRDAVAKAFAEMLKDGTYAAVLKKWELSDAKVDTLMINGEAKN
jgi:polar amino acid transport system substrate-binding protein